MGVVSPPPHLFEAKVIAFGTIDVPIDADRKVGFLGVESKS